MPAHRRGAWSSKEDEELLHLIHNHGSANWVQISSMLGTRNSKQCRERYHQHLKPTLCRSPITEEEGELIIQLVAQKGKRWAEIARYFDGRSDNTIKNWWNSLRNRHHRHARRREKVEDLLRRHNEQQRRQAVDESQQELPSQPINFSRPFVSEHHDSSAFYQQHMFVASSSSSSATYPFNAATPLSGPLLPHPMSSPAVNHCGEFVLAPPYLEPYTRPLDQFSQAVKRDQISFRTLPSMPLFQ